MSFLTFLFTIILLSCSPSGHGPEVTGEILIADTGADSTTDTADAPKATVQAVLNEAYWPLVLSLIDGAKTDIWVVHFELNHDTAGNDLVEHLIAAAGRGVDIHVLLENDVDANASRVKELKAGGVQAKLDSPERYTHTKLVVVDGRRALLGSTNWSFMSMKRNNEANVLLTDGPHPPFYRSYAESLWKDPIRSPALKPLTTELGTGMVDGCYVAIATELIKGASESVDILVYGMNANPRYPDSDVNQFIDLLVQAKDRGVKVRLILEAAGYDAPVNEVNEQAADILKAHGLSVRFDPLDQISHAKVTIVDKQVMITSNNWGHGGFNLYHEVGFKTDREQVVSAMKTYFDSIWSESSKP